MRPSLWFAALLGATVVLPAICEEGLSIDAAVDAALAGHRSVVEVEAAARSAALALRLAEIDHSRVAVTLSATPSAGVDLAPLQTGTWSDVADTFDVRGSGTFGAAVALPWGMEIAGSYTAELDLNGPDGSDDSLLDVHSLSVSQDLLPGAGLSATALAVEDRRDQLRLAGLRLRRARNEVALQAARTFLTLIERQETLARMQERLAFAERDLDHTRLLVSQQAADQLELLNATIAAAEQRNALDALRAGLTLDTAQFLADLGLPAAPLTAPDTADPATLRWKARALLAEPTPPAAITGAVEVMEADAALTSAALHAERARSGALPELSLSLDYRKTRSAPRPGSLSFSITGSYTLFDGGRTAGVTEQAQEQLASARRSLATSRSEVEQAFARARLALTSALADQELAALQLQRAQLQREQAARRHAAGAISERALQEADLLLREAHSGAAAATLSLANAYLSILIDLGADLRQELAAIAP